MYYSSRRKQIIHSYQVIIETWHVLLKAVLVVEQGQVKFIEDCRETIATEWVYIFVEFLEKILND